MNKFFVIGVVLVFVLAVVLVSMAVRSSRTATAAAAPAKSAKTRSRPGHYVPPKDPGRPMQEDVAARAYDEVTLRTTFKNYRTAIATGNSRLRDALHPALAKDLGKVLTWAEEERAKATEPRDIVIAEKTIESLRKQP